MKVKSYRQALVMGFILILGIGRLLLENVSLSRSSRSVGKMVIYSQNAFRAAFDRFSEVEEHCSFVASEASPLLLDNSWWVPKQFSLPHSGEWEQEKGSAPLLPLHFQLEDKFSKEASLSLYTHHSDFQNDLSTKLANLTASLRLYIYNNESNVINYGKMAGIEVKTATAHLGISFQGIYAESNSGYQKMCMLGRSKVPLQYSNASAHWEWSAPPLVEDDKILLHLQIPPSNGLTTRYIFARLTSFRASDHPLFFDPVDITFPLGYSAPYKFITDSMVESACNAHVHENKSTDLELYQGKYQCCEFLRSILEWRTLEGIPNWQCKGPVEYCNRVGPFSNQGGFGNSRILIQDFECFESSAHSDYNISAAIRAVPAVEHNTESSGLGSVRENRNTMWIQGTWRKASPGKICMVGCLASTLTPACDFLVCVYIPKSLSLTQRNMIVGFISSIHSDSKAFYPLSFEQPIQPHMFLSYGLYSEMSYRYAKNNIAESLLEQKKSKTMGDLIQWHLFKYPWKKVGRSRASFYILGRDLSVHSTIASSGVNSNTMMDLDILAMEKFVGIDLSSDKSYDFNSATQSCILKQDQIPQEERRLLKVGAQLELHGIFPTLFKLSVEGVYDPQMGKMNLVGCLDIRARTEILHSYSSIDVEDGLDCQIELKLQYPPKNFRLLTDRSVKVSIRSNRTESDQLYFKPMEFHTEQILYNGQTAEAIPRRTLEPVLNILSLCLASACIVSQLVYVMHNETAAAYISLVMVGIQALGYGISLITGIDHFYFASSDSPYKGRQDLCAMEEGPSTIFYILISVMLLLAFTLTVRLFHTVWKCRLPLTQVPSEKWVLLSCTVMYAISLVMEICAGIATELVFSLNYDMETVPVKMEWKEAVRAYVRLIQDFFLLPQVFWISEWKYSGKSLRKFYYVGITALCLLPQIYNYVYDRHSRRGNIRVGSIAAVTLAVVVYLRQTGSKEGGLRR